MPQYVIDTLKPKNNNNFPVAEAVDVLYEEGSTVKDKIIAINALIVAAQQLIEGIQTDISELQSGKVDKVSGKGLSTNDFTNAYRDKIDDTYTKSETDTALAGKVDKVSGKGLSTNDFTNTYKNKVDNTYTKTETDSAIAGKIAEVVAEAPESLDTLKEIADWIDTHADSASAMNSAIQANAANIEKKVDKVEGKTLSSNDFTDVYKNKVDNTYIKAEIDSKLKDKVDKVSGKGLSTNDFTDEYQTRVHDAYANTIENASEIEKLKSSKADKTALSETNQTVENNRANLQGQIDVLVVEASGDSNAEVVQARVDTKGESHATLKERLDTMEAASRSALKKYATGEEVTFITRNNILASEYTEGKYYGYVDGKIADNANYGYFDYVFVEGGVEYYISHTQCHICFYDENKTFISGINNVTTSFNTFTTPSNAKYMIVSCMIGHRNYIYARKSNTITTNNKSTKQRLSGDIAVGLGNIEGLSEELENTKNDELIEYALIQSSFTEGYFYNYATGVKQTNNTYGYYSYIEIKPDTTYYINLFGHICFYDSSKNYISGWENTSNTSNKAFTTPSNAKYMIVSCMIGHKEQIYISTEWGENITKIKSRNTDVLKKKFAIQKESLANILADILPADSTIVVDKNGNGNYTTVTEACQNAGEYNTIYIMPGVYENEEIWGTNTKTLYLVGADKHTCIIKNNTGQYAHPPMNIGSGLVQNLTIYAEKTDTSNDEKTYAIHAESHKMHNNSLRIDNCILKSDFGPALGMGMRSGCHVELSNTDFICTKADDALYFHDSDYDAYLGEQNITIRNCLIYSPKCWHTIYLQSQEKEGSMTYVEFLHNTFKCTTPNVCAAVNWYSQTPTNDENDFKGLKNWRIKETSWGNSYADFNVVS